MEKYVKEYKRQCPRTQRDAVHKVEYAKATCSRVLDPMLHFTCSLGADVKTVKKITRMNREIPGTGMYFPMSGYFYILNPMGDRRLFHTQEILLHSFPF